MSQIVVSAGKYIREQNLLASAGSYVRPFGKKALIIGGKTALSVAGPKLVASLMEEGISIGEGLIWYGGEASWKQVERLIEMIEAERPDLLITVGGGKALDTGKAVAYAVNLPLVAVPTIAATCAATTAIAIMYNDQGAFIEISRRAKAPDLVLVDMDVIRNVPVRFLSSGIGDTLAKWFESKASSQNVRPTAQTRSAVQLAKLLYDILLESGAKALESLHVKRCTEELEDVVDAIILISGSVSGYGGDACRTAGAHAIYSGLTIFPQVHESCHGEIVAFGILAQLALERAAESEIEQLIRFYKEVNLPTSLAEMGITLLTEEEWQRLGEISVAIEDMANMPFPVTPEMVIQAVQEADKYGRRVVAERGDELCN